MADRLEVIISLPGQPLRHYATSLSQNQVEDTINQLRQNLVIRSKRKFMPQATLVYDWLIRPIEADLAKMELKLWCLCRTVYYGISLWQPFTIANNI